MSKTLVMVFDDEAKAYGVLHALQGLDEHGLPGGPVDVAIGLIGGGVIGAVRRNVHSLDKEFEADISNALPQGRTAVIVASLNLSPSAFNRVLS